MLDEREIKEINMIRFINPKTNFLLFDIFSLYEVEFGLVCLQGKAWHILFSQDKYTKNSE